MVLLFLPFEAGGPQHMGGAVVFILFQMADDSLLSIWHPMTIVLPAKQLGRGRKEDMIYQDEKYSVAQLSPTTSAARWRVIGH